MYEPVPLPFVVFPISFVIRVGAVVVLQTTPLAVTGCPPSAVTLPPLSEEDEAIDVTDVVVTIGGVKADKVVNDC